MRVEIVVPAKVTEACHKLNERLSKFAGCVATVSAPFEAASAERMCVVHIMGTFEQSMLAQKRLRDFVTQYS